jgi:hypothetical protein
MTTGTSPEAAARHWAAELLGVPEDASPPEARRAYFRKVRESDFLPPRSWRRALRVFEGASTEPDEEWLVANEGRLRAEAAAFAEAFFTLPVPQRRERWQALHSACADIPPLLAQLEALKAGLEIETEGLPRDESHYGRLVEHLLQSSLLPLVGRYASRQAFLRRIEESSTRADRKAMEKAAQYLLAERPVIAALDVGLVRHVANLRGQLQRERKIRRQRVAARGGFSSGSSWWWVFVVFAFVSVLLHLRTSSENSSPGPLPRPNFSAPQDHQLPKGLENMRRQVVIDPETGAQLLLLVPSNMPPLYDLLDPSQFDVEYDSFANVQLFLFSRRSSSTITGPDGLPVFPSKPIPMGESTLSMMGVSQEQLNNLSARAAAKKQTGSVGRTPSKAPAGGNARP